VKTAGTILSALFDEKFMKKAQGYSKLHNSWEEITTKNGIAAAAAHSRIKELNKGILLIETDHPGWKQILQTKQSQLLDDYRTRFPDLEIFGISLILGYSKQQTEPDTTPEEKPEPEPELSAPAAGAEINAQDTPESSLEAYEVIKDPAFREKLIRLGKTIADSEAGCK